MADATRSRVRYGTGAPGIERADVFLDGRAFSPHRHDTYVVGVTTAGVQSFGYRGQVRRSCAGQVFVLHPDELHDGRAGTEGGFGYRAIYISPDLIGRALGGRGLPFVPEPVSMRPALREAVATALADFDAEIGELRWIEIVAALASALADASDGRRKRPVVIDADAMRRVRDRLVRDAVGGVSASELEREGGLDRWSLYRQFRKAYGVSPYRYMKMRRLDLARRSIAAGQSLAEAAYASGFADQSHMTRQFRETYGLSPGRWRLLLRQDLPRTVESQENRVPPNACRFEDGAHRTGL